LGFIFLTDKSFDVTKRITASLYIRLRWRDTDETPIFGETP